MLTLKTFTPPAASTRVKTNDLLELLGFALIVLLPAIMSNFGLSPSGQAEHQSLYSQIGFVKELLSSLQFGLVAAFFLSRRPHERSWNDVATSTVSWPTQILVGIGMWFAYYLFFDFWALIASLASIRTPSIAWLHPVGNNEELLNAVFSGVNGISEEVMRVYLLLQIQRVGLGRTGAAIAVAMAISSYHVYQGPFTVIAFVLVNIVFNRLYLSKRPLLALIVWHILSDFKHSTDLVGWEFVTAMVNGTFSFAFGTLAIFFGFWH